MTAQNKVTLRGNDSNEWQNVLILCRYFQDCSNLNKHLVKIDVCWNIVYIIMEIAVQTDVMAQMPVNMVMSTSQEKWNLLRYICPIATVYVRDIFLLVTFLVNFEVSSDVCCNVLV
jgi:hypothetical protein